MRPLKVCKNCGTQYISGAFGYCDPCDSFKRRRGHYPDLHEIRSRKRTHTLCTHCQQAYATRRGLCNACAKWEERHHEPRPAYRWQKICKDCRENLVRAKGLCNRCYQWRRNHHGKRRPRYKNATQCSNCGSPNVYAKGQCCACYKYEYHFGKPRPAKLWRERWNPDASPVEAHVKRRCKICGKPSYTQDGYDHAFGRCRACYSYWLKHGKQQERQPWMWQRWAPQGWCDCGRPAVTEVTLNVEHGATKYKLCNDCYRAEVGHD